MNYLCVILEKKITVGEVQVVLKFGKLTVFAKTYDVCELAVKYGHGCPVLPGTVSTIIAIMVYCKFSEV